jgi:nucleotide-binding universal stress UspA family protein
MNSPVANRAPVNTPRVLLALSGRAAPATSLRRARTLSLAIGADLHILRVGLANTTRRDHADFIQQTTSRVQAIGARLIIVDAQEGSTSALLASVAHGTRAAVLVARDPRPDGVILAATALRTSHDDVLEAGAELASQVKMAFVAMHNVAPVSLGVGPEIATLMSLPQHSTQHRLRTLDQAASALRSGAQTVVTRRCDPVDAILREAHIRDADLIVIGTRRRAWWRRLTGQGVTARLVNRAGRSVLIVPLTEPDPKSAD